METIKKKLYRNKKEAIIGGVCKGLADYFEVDETLVRLIFLVLTIGAGSGILIYLVLWWITPVLPNETGASEENRGAEIKEFVNKVGSEAREIISEVKGGKTEHHGVNMIGVGLILIGAIVLLNRLMPQVWGNDLMWPMVLMFVGGFILFKR